MPTALIVEDEPDANRLLTLLVQLRGYRTHSTLSGEEALRWLGPRTPDVILLDLMLPDVDGFEICRRLKADPETTLVPIVVVSAALAAENRTRCFRLGALAYVPKPYVAEQIFEALDAAETWNRELSQHGNAGAIRLDAGDEDFARGLSRLRALLLARAPLGDRSSARILEALEAIRDEARDFGDRHRVERVATLAYKLREDRLVLTVDDEAGWFATERRGDRDSALSAELSGAFDEVATAESGRKTILTKHFGPPSAT